MVATASAENRKPLYREGAFWAITCVFIIVIGLVLVGSFMYEPNYRLIAEGWVKTHEDETTKEITTFLSDSHPMVAKIDSRYLDSEVRQRVVWVYGRESDLPKNKVEKLVTAHVDIPIDTFDVTGDIRASIPFILTIKAPHVSDWRVEDTDMRFFEDLKDRQ